MQDYLGKFEAGTNKNFRNSARGEMQSSDEMVFLVTVDAKFSMSQECILTGN